METTNGSFTMQLLVDKLTKLNNSQQSIETLSHWCVFHRRKAKQVVEAWNQQFYCSPRDQRVSYLYLANDILQNSRRKGWEFVGEFWKVLPDALNDVTVNGDIFGKNAVLRLLQIWEERKVFGPHGHTLKEELLGRNGDGRNKNGSAVIYKLKHPEGDMLEKLVSCYEHFYEGLVDEEVLFEKSQSAVDFVEKLESDTGSCFNTGSIKGSETLDQLQGKHKILQECVEKLKAVESYRSTMLSHLIDALREQESKLDQVRKQLQAAQSWHDQVVSICHNSGHSLSEPRLKDSPSAPPSFTSEAPFSNGEQFIPASYTEQAHLINSSSSSEDENRKTDAAAAETAKLTPSISSEQVLSSVLPSVASGGIDQSMTENYPSNSKKVKLGVGGVPLHSPPHFQPQPPHPPFALAESLHQPPPPPPPPFPHPDSFPQPPPPSSPMPPMNPTMPLHLPPTSPIQHPPAPPDTFSPPMLLPPQPPDYTLTPMPLPPLLPPTMPFMQTIGPMTGMPCFYTPPHLLLQRPPHISSYPTVMPARHPIPPEPFYASQGAEGVGAFGQPPQPTGSPSVSHQ